jgi:hypothetical protein
MLAVAAMAWMQAFVRRGLEWSHVPSAYHEIMRQAAGLLALGA